MATVRVDQQSSLAQLRRQTALRARESFSFFVRAALGLRRFEEARLEEVAAGKQPATPVERQLLDRWFSLRAEDAEELTWLPQQLETDLV